jgi:hypothetical protein
VNVGLLTPGLLSEIPKWWAGQYIGTRPLSQLDEDSTRQQSKLTEINRSSNESVRQAIEKENFSSISDCFFGGTCLSRIGSALPPHAKDEIGFKFGNLKLQSHLIPCWDSDVIVRPWNGQTSSAEVGSI